MGLLLAFLFAIPTGWYVDSSGAGTPGSYTFGSYQADILPSGSTPDFLMWRIVSTDSSTERWLTVRVSCSGSTVTEGYVLPPGPGTVDFPILACSSGPGLLEVGYTVSTLSPTSLETVLGDIRFSRTRLGTRPTTTYGAGDPDTGADCGLNPFCYIKAAFRWGFVPSHIDERNTEITGSLSSHYPSNLIFAASDAIDAFRVGSSSCVSQSACWPDWRLPAFTISPGRQIPPTDIFPFDSSFGAWLRSNRSRNGLTLYALVFVGLAFQILASSVGFLRLRRSGGEDDS
jgi:hypothetical protein